MWLTESSWELMVLCLIGMAVFIALYSKTPASKYLVGVLGCALLGAAAFFVERLIVTEAERVEASVYGLAQACVSGDVDDTLAYVAPEQVIVREVIRNGMKLVDVGEDLTVTDLHVKLAPDRNTATSHFRANGTVALSGSTNQIHLDYAQHVSTRWLLTWSRLDDEWKISQLTRLNPISGETMNPLAQVTN